MNHNQSATTSITPMTEMVILSHEEQRRLIQCSYQHQYGFFIRLAMFTGLSSEELLELCWDDVDEYGSRLRIRNVTKAVVAESGMQQTNFPRFVPLLPYALNDLLEWREIQRHVPVSLPAIYTYKLPVTMSLEGRASTTESLQEYYRQILQFSDIPNYPFRTLRDTFAVRCLEQGMNLQTLSVILGDPAAASTYAQFAVSRQAANRASMETLYSVQSPNAATIAYPIIITPQDNGCAMLYSPDFPETACYCDNLAEALIEMRNRMQEDLFNSYYPPIPLDISRIPRRPNEFVILICLNL